MRLLGVSAALLLSSFASRYHQGLMARSVRTNWQSLASPSNFGRFLGGLFLPLGHTYLMYNNTLTTK